MRLFSPAAMGLFATATLLLAGCTDTPTQPAMLVTPETQAAIKLASSLPTLPEFVTKAHTADVPAGSTLGEAETRRAMLTHAQNSWQLAEVLGNSEEARALRIQAYDEAVPALAPILSDDDVAAAQQRLLDWAVLAGSVVQAAAKRPDALPGFADALRQGKTLIEHGVQDRLAGDRAAALERTLEAADVLAATTPRGVALSLTRAAESALVVAQRTPPDRLSAEELQRAARLVRSAREALADGDYERAIRRAYYARQLLK
jgi:hypothetical protein